MKFRLVGTKDFSIFSLKKHKTISVLSLFFAIASSFYSPNVSAHWNSLPTLSVFEEPSQILNNDPCNANSSVRNISGYITKVSDGDTVKVDNGEEIFSIRMLGIDTPETKYFGKSQGYWGEVASETLHSILPIGTKVTVKFDRTRCDGWKRVLGYVYMGTKNINRQMLEESLAVNYCIFPNIQHCQDFSEVTKKSVANHEGIFGDRMLELPYVWRKKIRNGKMDKYVGSLYKNEVYYPQHYERFGIAERIFYMRQKDVLPPKRFVKE